MTRPSETDASAVDKLLSRARANVRRVTPEAAARAAARGALLVDIRPVFDRATNGDIPGALVIERNVLEWRLDPSSPHHIAELNDDSQTVIIVCNEGYASSLAAATLQQLGLRNATDVIGGFAAWKAADLPVESSQ